MAVVDADRNLLFGVLALQIDFISREALVAAVTEWTRDRSRPLDEILVGQGWLTEARRALLESLVSEHLKMHGDDPERSLAAVKALGPVCDHLGEVGDADVQATRAQATGLSPSSSTLSWVVGPSTSDGLRFRVLRPHARGGIGVVSVALDAELNREVALKEIQPAQADDPGSRERFVLEAEITGRLEHPGVVPVYGLGSSPAGRPYYAMRLVKGDTLKEAIERFHREGETRLELRGLLNRFVAVCNAVAYAHSRGILHRDLKPANILLGPYGETLVVDWGLAKVIGRAESVVVASPEATLRPLGAGSGLSDTADGSAFGTPAYMSPEQAEGRLNALGPVSDVYSLGATLYYLLTGRPPFSDGDVATILRQVRQGGFSPPRTVNPNVPRALESVCAKAMALRPEDRYGSARALADDLEHWLADEPIAAYREPALPRMARWGRRHRPLVAGAAALLLTTVAAMAVGMVLLGYAGARTERQRLRAEANADEARRQSELARANLQTARRAVEVYFVQVSENTLLKSPLPGLQTLRKQLLESALEYYKEFVRQGGDDPGLRKELAQAYLRVGIITADIGTPADSLLALGLARDLYKPLSIAHPEDASLRGELARTHRWIGRMEAGTRRPTEAIASFRRAIALGEELVAGHPTPTETRVDLAWSYNNLGALLHRIGEPAAGRRAYEQAITNWEVLVREHRNPEFRVGQGQSYANLGWNLCIVGRLDDAIDANRKAVDAIESAIREDDTVPIYRSRLGATLDNLGVMYLYAGRPVEGEAVLRKALAVIKTLVDGNPAVTAFREIEIETYDNFGHLLAHNGRDAEARIAFETAINKATGLPDDQFDTYSRAYSYRGLGKLLRKEGRAADASEAFRKAVEINETTPVEKPYSLYELTCARALCSAMAGEGKVEVNVAEQATKRRHADRAMESLQEAVAGGWENLAWMKVDPDLDTLRSRADFRAMIHRLEVKSKVESTATPGTTAPHAPKS